MLLKDAAKEFKFNCKCRKLSDKTIKNYSKLISYLLNYLRDKHQILTLEDTRPVYIKGYLIELQEKGKKPQYINDQLKAFKVLFRYLYEEGYTDTILTERIKNVKQPKTIIQTFTSREIKDIVGFYNGHTYIEMRNKLILMVFFDTGIRLSELINLKISQVMSISAKISDDLIRAAKWRLAINHPLFLITHIKQSIICIREFLFQQSQKLATKFSG